LLLVLDIDHTLVHCTKDDRAECVMNDPAMKNETFKMYFEETGDKPYYLKLRPFIKPFLETLSQFFHLAVYTMGGKTYAKQVMKIIDPNNSILKKRLVCRDDHDDNVKVLQRMFPCDERMVLVVDDRDDVWSTPQNVLKIWKFEFWPSDANDDDANMAPQESRGRQTPDEDWAIDKLRQRNHDNILGTTANVLQAIHRIYYHDESLYRSHQVCAHSIYSQLQKRVFSGVHIVFSGVFPNNERPEDTQEWKLAVQYGANCHLALNERVTHVVAARAGTAKVHKARDMDVYVVHINWLRQSVIHFIRMFEPDFPIGSRVKPAIVSAHCSQPIDIMELSDFILDAPNKKLRVFRPSELYLTALDPSHRDYDKDKFKKYRYFVQQREKLLAKKRLPSQPSQNRAAPPQNRAAPPQSHAPPPQSHAPIPQPPPVQAPPQPIVPPQPQAFRYPNQGYAVPQGQRPILNSRLPPTGAGPLISNPMPNPPLPPVSNAAMAPTQPMRRAVRRPKQNAAPPPQNFSLMNNAPPVNNTVQQAVQPPMLIESQPSIQDIQRVKQTIVNFLQDKYWTPLEVIYVHLREHFDVSFLKKVGLEDENFYKQHEEFKITHAERRWIVRLSNVAMNGIPGKRTSNDAGHSQQPPTKRKKIEANRDPSPVPDFARANHRERIQEKERTEQTYTQIKANKKNGWVVPPDVHTIDRRKLRSKTYGPPGQERNLHPLNPADYRSRQACKFYKDGNCLKQKCPFLHEQIQLYMRPPNDEWLPLAETEFRKNILANMKKKKNKKRKNHDQHDRRKNRRETITISDDESSYFSPQKRRTTDDDDDFSSLLKQHLGDNFHEENETPRDAKKRKRIKSPQKLESEESPPRKKSNEGLFDENLRIVGTVEKIDEEEEGECSDDSDDDELEN